MNQRNLKLRKGVRIASTTTSLSGWREVGEKRCYFRSKMEANYARYLEWLKIIGEIVDWHHEPKTFWFEGIKRGVVSYLPDFEVTNRTGTVEFHEVKGFFDKKSQTKLKRMAKYHPDVKIVFIGMTEFKAIARKAKLWIPTWE